MSNIKQLLQILDTQIYDITSFDKSLKSFKLTTKKYCQKYLISYFRFMPQITFRRL